MVLLTARTAPPTLIQTSTLTVNNQLPAAEVPRNVSLALNHVMVHRRKVVFLLRENWLKKLVDQHFVSRFMSGCAPADADLQVVFTCLLGPSDLEAELTFTVTPTGGAGESKTIYYNEIASGGFNAALVSPATVTFDIQPDTEYTINLDVATATFVQAVLGYETCSSDLDTSNALVSDDTQFANATITWEKEADLATTANTLWEANGPAVITFTLNTASPPNAAYGLTWDTSTWTNPFDSVTETQDANSPGWKLDLAYHNRKGVNTTISGVAYPAVRCRAYVYGFNLSDSTFQLRYSNNGLTCIDSSWYGAGVGWSTFDVYLPATNATKIDLMLAESGGSEPSVFTLYMQEYEG